LHGIGENTPDQGGDIRLWDESGVRHAHLRIEHVYAPGRVDHRQVRERFAGAPRQCGAIDSAWQIDVGKQHIHRRRIEVAQRICCIRYRMDSETLFRQRFRNPFADQKLILDEQNSDRPDFVCYRPHGSGLRCLALVA